jgi:hypothetical protein
MESRSNRHSIRQFVDGLVPGSRVVWIANGGMGTVQPDKTILWDDGHHMTHKQMNDTHALLIHSEAEKRQLQQTLARRVDCLKGGCTLVRWDADGCRENHPQHLCPLALVSDTEVPADLHRRKRQPRSTRVHSAS